MTVGKKGVAMRARKCLADNIYAQTTQPLHSLLKKKVYSTEERSRHDHRHGTLAGMLDAPESSSYQSSRH
jgi:hypothetical protein